QPWSFLIAANHDKAEFEKLLGCLSEKNREWARHAGVLMISVAALNFERNGKPNRHAFHDVGQAAAYLTVQAMELGLWVHQMAGIDVEKIREAYAIPPGYEPVAGIALGYAATAERLPPGLQQRHIAPRSRKPLADFVFTGKWGESSHLI
ncbi:MAG: nitroreductase family protein, partial [Bryobacteraceae bacterium]